MRTSCLAHRWLPGGPQSAATAAGTGAGTDPSTESETEPGTDQGLGPGDGWGWLLATGHAVELGPGLVGGTPLLERLFVRVEDRLADGLEQLALQSASLPASEGEALVNLMAHLGWAGAEQGLYALGTGFREDGTMPEGMRGLSLYRRLDAVRLVMNTETCAKASAAEPSGPDAAPDALTRSLLDALHDLGLPDVLCHASGELRHRDVALGRSEARVLGGAPDGAAGGELRMAHLDLHAVVGALAEVHHDERGLAWPVTCAPFAIGVLEAAGGAAAAVDMANKLEVSLEAEGHPVLLFDGAESPGEQRQRAEALGLPVRIVCGPTSAQGELVVETRGGEKPERIPIEALPAWLAAQLPAVAPLAGAGKGASSRARRRRALY